MGSGDVGDPVVRPDEGDRRPVALQGPERDVPVGEMAERRGRRVRSADATLPSREDRQARLGRRNLAPRVDGALAARSEEEPWAHHVLRGADQQIPVRAQCVVEDLIDVLLRAALEIDQKIAAADQVEVRERGIREQVVMREDDDLAHFLVHAVAAVLLAEEPLESLLAHVRCDLVGVEPGARSLERALVQVAGEDLDLGRRIVTRRLLEAQHGERVRFLARGTSDRPYAHIGVDARLAGEDLRQDLPLQVLEDLGIAEEVRDGDEEVVAKCHGLFGRRAHALGVDGEIFDLEQLHPASDPAQERRLLVAAVVASGVRAYLDEDLPQQRAGRVGGRTSVVLDQNTRTRLHETHQGIWDVGQRQHEIDESRADRALGHSGILRLVRLLGDGQPGLLLDRLDSQAAVASGSRQDHADRVAIVRRGQRAEEMVHGGAIAGALLELGQAQMRVDRLEIGAGRDDVDVVRL
jgi:hypothetical protein